jgi:hypothetical protein
MPKFKITVKVVHEHVFTVDAPNFDAAVANKNLDPLLKDPAFMQKHLVASYEEDTSVDEIPEPEPPTAVFLIRVDYRIKAGRRVRRINVIAISPGEAIDRALAQAQGWRGVVKVDSAQCLDFPSLPLVPA